jgi:phosphatidate cytidylyltransferase
MQSSRRGAWRLCKIERTDNSTAVAKSNLTVRVLTSVVAVPLLLAVLFYGPPLAWACLLFAAAAVAGFELFAMTTGRDGLLQAAGVTLSVALALVLYFATHSSRALLTLSLAVTLVGLLLPLFRVTDISRSGLQLMSLAAGPWYVGALLTSLSLLRRDFGAGWVVLVLSVAWLADTGGYFVGRKFGNAKLYPKVSPNKTWAGLYGALLGSTLAGVVAALTYLPELPLLNGVVLGMFGGVFGQMGDLVESLLKRSVGVKDSGNIIPGHGGILDRIDAVLFVAPLTYVYALWFVAGR